MNILGILIALFICLSCIAIWIYCINDLIQDFKKMRQDLIEDARNKRKKKRRW
jgi:hypothetical protein